MKIKPNTVHTRQMSDQMPLVWIPDPTEVFVQAQLIERKTVKDSRTNKDQEIGVVRIKNKEVEVSADEISPVNPTTFDKIDDMSELTHLNEASVLYNLENRYRDDMIYTYSGLFLVAINPYTNIKIYAQDYINLYHGSPKEDNRPHIFAVAELAYQNLLSQKQDQSILVTGESGAGKTENTKKILQYFASVTSEDKLLPVTQGHDNFERKILQSNPILESFGNAQTVRNNNSSRFGKFIKIEFDEFGKINGAHIEWYLLEKSRVIHQHSRERNYHIFYQLLSGMSSQDLRKLQLDSNSIMDYNYLRYSNPSIPGVDDSQDFHELMAALAVVGFSEEEIYDVLKIIALILHIGNVEFVSERADQASIKSDITPLCKLLGVSESDFKIAVLKPRAKAGKEYVSQAKNSTQARFILNSLSRSLYEKLFAHVVRRINKSLDHGSMTENYIGLLDIAGFEIFKDNSFEQLCINYTNEKLQQFFNHHMFVLEQNEYLKENIQWNFMDYGKDLQTTIDLIEKKNQPPGVLSLLDEESILPKSTDASFYSKLLSVWDNKSSKFKRSKLDNCFILKHYAGDVEYNVEGWLSKNKDPLNENLLKVLSNSSNELISDFFADNVRAGSFRTASHRHREQLASLLDHLSSTDPHFVRCIIPNNKKKARDFNRQLILDQLRCNGVLEGIRIAREGYPNRIFFKEFFQRYKILSDEHRFSNSSKKNCEIVLSSLHLDPSLFKVGNTKLFFKAGVLAELEAKKEERMSKFVTKFNATARGNFLRAMVNNQLKKLQAARVLATTFKTYNRLMEDPWYNLYIKIKPLLESSQEISKTKKIAEQVKSLEKELESLETERSKLREKNTNYEDELNKVREMLTTTTESLENHQRLLCTAKSKEAELEREVKEITLLKKTLDDQKLNAKKQYEDAQREITSFKEISSERESSMKQLESEKKELQLKLNQINSEISIAKKSEVSLTTTAKSLKGEIEELKALGTSKQREIDDLKTKLKTSDEELELKMKSLEKSFEITSKRLNTLVEENKDLRGQIDTAKKEASETQRQLDSKERELKRLAEKNEQHQSEISLLAKSRDDLVSEHSKVVAELKHSRKEVSEYKQRCQKLEEECTSIKKQLEEEIASLAMSKVETNDGNDQSSDSREVSLLQDELLKERSLNRFLNERLISNSDHTSRHPRHLDDLFANRSISNGEILKEYDDMKLQLKETTYKLEKEIEEKKDLISRLRFTETRLASSSFDNQTMNAQLKKLRNLIEGANLDVDLEKELGDVAPIDFNHEKMMLELDYLKRQLYSESRAREEAENVAAVLHKKFKQIHRSDSVSDIFKLKYEASEALVQSLESKLNSSPMKNRTSLSNKDIFTRKNSVSKYAEDLKFHKLENYKLQELLVEHQKQISDLNREINRSRATEAVLMDQISRLEKDLESTEKQNDLLASSVKHHKNQYENCVNDLHATETQLRDLGYSLKHSAEDIRSMGTIIQKLKSQNKQKEKAIWESESRNNDLESQLEERTIELRKVQSLNEVLQSDLNHFKERMKATDDSDRYTAEIQKFKSSLDASMRVETELKKKISTLTYSLETLKSDTDAKIEELLRQNEHYENLVEQLGSQKDISEATQKDLETKLKTLINKTNSLSDSVDTLLKLKQELEAERDYLRSKLEDSNTDFENSLRNREEIANNVHLLKESLDLQQQQNQRNESLVQQLQNDARVLKAQLENEKERGIVLHEENQSLGKSNNQLRERINDLENKISDTTEKDAWLSKIHELEERVTVESESKFEEMKKTKNLERMVEELQTKNSKQADVISTANKDRGEFEERIMAYSEQIDSMENHISKQEVALRRMERDSNYYQNRVNELEQEIELWKNKYNGLSSRRKSLSVQPGEEIFI